MRIEEEIKQSEFINEYQKLLINIMYTNNWLTHNIHDTLQGYGITGQQYNVLRILRGCHPGSCTISDVRDRMLDKMSDASRIIERLRIKGLVLRNQGKKDKRAAAVSITLTGLDLLSEIGKVSENFYNILNTLKPTEAKRLNDLLDKMRG